MTGCWRASGSPENPELTAPEASLRPKSPGLRLVDPLAHPDLRNQPTARESSCNSTFALGRLLAGDTGQVFGPNGVTRMVPASAGRGTRRSYARATKWKLFGPTERSSVARMAAALSWGPWMKRGLPWRPKLMALGPAHGPRWPVVAWKAGAGSKPRLRA